MSVAHPATEFIVALFGPHRSGRVYVASLPNIKNEGESEERHILTRSSAQIVDFTRRHDQPGEGCFVCVNLINDKATRRAEENVTQIVCVHADIDFSQVEATPEEVERIIIGLSLPPSRVHHSGHGLHVYWFLKIAIAATPENNDRHKRLLHRLADILGGDPSACLIPQLMRLPGTINSKNGERHEVRVLSNHTELRYELADLEQWVAAIQEPLLHRKIATDNGASPGNPFLAFAAAYAEMTPLDVEQFLADMIYRGPGGGGNAHDTLLRCSAALLTRGEKREIVIERCLAALALAAARSGLIIDPAREQAIIADMCDSWIAKISEREPEPENEPPPTKDSPPKNDKADETVSAEPTTVAVDLWNKLDPPPLPHGLLPSVIENFAFEQGATMGADPSGLAAAALTVCAAAIPDHIQLKVKRHSNWMESTRLWVGLVGGSAVKKTPIIYQAARPLHRIDADLCRTYAAAMAQWDALDRNTKRVTPRPLHIRIKLEDTTVEAAQEVLRDSPNGVLCLRDELSGFFGAMDKYSGTRGAAVDRAFWLQAFNGVSYSIDRIGRGSGFIEHLSISILGGIQPESMRKLVDDTVDDGLIQRLIPVMLRQGAVDHDEPISEATTEYEILVERLYAMLQPTAEVMFCDAARELRQELARKHHELVEIEFVNKKLAAHFGKYDGIFARLCLLWHCIESPSTPQISEACARRVADFVTRFLFPHAVAFYADIYGLSEDYDSLTAVAGYILTHKLTRPLTNRDLQRSIRTMRNLRRQEMESIWHQLDALGWVTQAPRRRVTDPPHWNVNPEVHRRFQERAEQERVRQQRIREKFATMLTGQKEDNP